MREYVKTCSPPLKNYLHHHSVFHVACSVFVVLFFLLLLVCYGFWSSDLPNSDVEAKAIDTRYNFDRKSPLIFIGGFPRSGTTLMRAMLDAHPDIRCGQETRILPRILHLRAKLPRIERERMKEAGVTDKLLDRAMTAFILEVMVHHGEPASRICSKDPFFLSYTSYLHKLFPNAKFIFMVRDGRASVYSAITRNVTISGFDFNDPRSCLEKWNSMVSGMYDDCRRVGPQYCMMVHYEQLVLHPVHWAQQILLFLGVPWNDAVLHHELLINQPGGIKLSRLEKSSDQIIKPLNVEPLDKWVGFYADDILADMKTVAPMLSILGYDPNANPPNYGTPDFVVSKNTELIKKRADFWKEQAIKLHLVHKDLVEELYGTTRT